MVYEIAMRLYARGLDWINKYFSCGKARWAVIQYFITPRVCQRKNSRAFVMVKKLSCKRIFVLRKWRMTLFRKRVAVQKCVFL